MANNGPSTNSNQFYYTFSNAMVRWKTHYFGHVVGKGMDVVNLIDQNDIMKK
jgi:peptidylprolyl isomerase